MRQTLVLAQDLRVATNNRSIVQSSMKSKMHDKTHEIDSFFEYMTISFNRNVEIQGKKYSENFEQHVIITNDIANLIDKVILHRELNNENVLVRVGLDGGGGFLIFFLIYLISLHWHHQILRKVSQKGLRTRELRR